MSTAQASTEAPSTWTVRAPGRVNLIGEHTDYNDGFVLPAAISLETRVTVHAAGGRRVELSLAETGEEGAFDLDAIPAASGTWLDYVAGVAKVLQHAGHRLVGIRATIASTLPMSAGLSSSAALELASAWAMLGPEGPVARGIDRLELARLCQRAENEYVGVASGLMDQFAVSCSRKDAAMLLDCRSLEHREVSLVGSGLALVAIDTGARRRLASSEYNERRRECERGVAILAARGLPVRALRDVTTQMLDEAASDLDDVTLRRCRHVVQENGRVLEAVAALEAGDRRALGESFAASHASLRDLFEVSSPALDAAVAIARRTPGVVATRMTGAGFGGCTVALVEGDDAVERLRAAMDREYRPLTGLDGRVHPVKAVEGAGFAPDGPDDDGASGRTT